MKNEALFMLYENYKFKWQTTALIYYSFLKNLQNKDDRELLDSCFDNFVFSKNELEKSKHELKVIKYFFYSFIPKGVVYYNSFKVIDFVLNTSESTELLWYAKFDLSKHDNWNKNYMGMMTDKDCRSLNLKA